MNSHVIYIPDLFTYPMTCCTEISPDGTGVSNPKSCAGKGFLLKHHGPVQAKLVMQLLLITRLTQMESWEYHMPEIARSCYYVS